jgi:predicted metal-dependent hydrolase
MGRADWIRQNSAHSQPAQLMHGHRIGKSHRLEYKPQALAKTTTARLGINSITISSHLDLSHEEVQQKARSAAERALKKESLALLAPRLEQIAKKNGLAYKSIKIKRLTSRWGSCSSGGLITLNYFLVQLPWHLIDYVLAHELAHTVHLNHSREFWALVEQMIPDAKARRREIKSYRPVLLPDR